MLDNSLELSDLVSFYVPSTWAKDQPIDANEYKKRIDAIAEHFSNLFGGATVAKGIGYYVANDGSLIQEEVSVVSSIVIGDLNNDDLSTVLEIASVYANAWLQESILVTTKDRLWFVESVQEVVSCVV